MLVSCFPWLVGLGWGCSSVGRASDRHAADTGSFPRCGKGFFSPRFVFQCRLSYGVRTLPCAIAYIYICAHVKDPVVHVKVRWIMETVKHPACNRGWVARLCRSWLSPGKVTEFPIGAIPLGQCSCKKSNKLTNTRCFLCVKRI